MSLFWFVTLPSLFLMAGITVLWARKLRLLSHTARHLEQIDIPNEVKEVRVNEVEMLAGLEADGYFLYAWDLTRWQRRRATSHRLREARKWLHLIIANVSLFQEVARFHIREISSGQAEADDLPAKVLNRASAVQVIAAACLVKLALIDACRFVWPLYIPELADHFQFRGHDLIAWYRHLAKDMLQLAKTYYDDITYTRFIFQLTGLFKVEDAEGLSRL